MCRIGGRLLFVSVDLEIPLFLLRMSNYLNEIRRDIAWWVVFLGRNSPKE